MISEKNAWVFPAALCACLLLVTVTCGPAKETAKEESRAAVPVAVDTSTAEEWRANCALHLAYHNGLIFTAVETTMPDGRRAVAWSTRDRAAYLDIFRKLVLDGVPDLKKRRDLILAEAAQAPGAGGIAILPRLDAMVRSFWQDIEAAALKHGVSCQPGQPAS